MVFSVSAVEIVDFEHSSDYSEDAEQSERSSVQMGAVASLQQGLTGLADDEGAGQVDGEGAGPLVGPVVGETPH